MEVYILKQYSKCIHVYLIYINILSSRTTFAKHANGHSDLQEVQPALQKASSDQMGTPDQAQKCCIPRVGAGKQVWAAQEEYGDIVPPCRERVRKVKAQPELKLKRDVKGNKNNFHKCTGSKRKTMDNVDQCLVGQGT